MLVGVHERRALDNTTSNGKLSAVTSEEGIDIASALATLVDTPETVRDGSHRQRKHRGGWCCSDREGS